MGFKINTNVSALNAQMQGVKTNKSLSTSLERLSSGLRINKAADDASGMAIADSLRTQGNSLGQAIGNANNAVGLIQTADKAMDEQLKILDTIKTKAIQAASDDQNATSRAAIQKDVNRLIEQLDNIAKTTSFNGQTLLSGSFTNKEFQVGAYSNQTIATSIGNTQSIATGNIATRSDIVQLGNTGALGAAASKDATTISAAELGIGIGDKIRIDGAGDYSVTGVNGTSGGATYTIQDDDGNGLAKDVAISAAISIVSTVDESVTGWNIGAVSSGTTISTSVSGDLSGVAVGDTLTFTLTSGATVDRTITNVNTTTGNVTISATVSAVASSVAYDSRATLGTAFATSDYVQYSVEGSTLTGVQLTDGSGYGVVNTGLGRVADLINETTAETGIKAVANVEQNSLIGVAAMTLTSDMTINGVTVTESGQTILAGDSDNTLIDSINAKSDLTGVNASIEPDGTLTLKTDGRSMNLTGFTDVSGINDGVYAGTLDLTKNGLEVMDVTASFFSDAALASSASDASVLEDIVDTHTLSEVVSGQKDSNGDGLVNNDDAVGLMRTQDGAMLAMDIVEAAITGLDDVRADLGAVQNQLAVTVNNISVAQVNVKAAESQIRDVDFAAESANFSKLNILAQSGSYALSQANAVQQNVLRLLQ